MIERFRLFELNNQLRLVNPNADDAKVVASYVKRARVRITHQAAAKAWAHGVPWAEALRVATKAVAAGKAVAKKPLATKKRGGKGKGKGKWRCCF